MGAKEVGRRSGHGNGDTLHLAVIACQSLWQNLRNRKKFIAHIMEHTRRKVKAVCKFGEILNRDEWSDHLAEEHGLTCFLSADATTLFCSFCDGFIMLSLAGPSAITTHYSTHLTD